MIVRAKLAVPGARPGTVERARLHRALDAAAAGRLTLVQGPAGYGKTTAVASWLWASGRPAAWVTLDRHDNEPRRLVAHVVAALAAVLSEGTLEATQQALEGGSDVELTVLPRLAEALGAARRSVTIVLDDYHVIDAEPARDVVRGLLELLPDSAHLVITSRTRPALRIARRAAVGDAVVIGVGQLAFGPAEAARLLNGAGGSELTEEDVGRAVTRLHGWATGLRLLATALDTREGSRQGVIGALGSLTRGGLVDYVVEEVLAEAAPAQRRLLLQTSVLASFDGSLAVAVTGDPGARELVARLGEDGQFVSTGRDGGGWVRVHEVIRDALLVALRRCEPESEPILRGRAATWFEQHGSLVEATEQLLAARDHERLAALVREHGMTLAIARQAAVLRPAIEAVRPLVEGDLLLEVVDVFVALQEGVHPRQLAPVAWSLHERSRDCPRVHALTAGLVAAPHFGEVSRSIEAGLEALRRLRGEPGITLRIAPGLAASMMWDGRIDEARAVMASALGGGSVVAEIIGQLFHATINAIEEQPAAAERHARRALALLDASGFETSAEFWSVRAATADAFRVAGRLGDARKQLDLSLELVRRRPGTMLHAGLLLTDTRLAVAERRRARARASLNAARAIYDTFPDVGRRLRAQVELLAAELSGPVDSARRGSTLTEAELRVLAELARGVTRAQIAAHLHVSESTVKTHLWRAYRRLGADNRAAAVAVARERGLLPAAGAP